MHKVLFWDFDGTLVWSDHLWSNAVLEAIKLTLDTDISLEDIRPLMKSGFTWHTPDRDYTMYKGTLWWEFMNKRLKEVCLLLGLDEARAASASEKVRERILIPRKYHLYEDTLSVLQKAMDLGYQNYIISNNYPELEEMLEKLNLSDYFSGYVVSAVIGYDKPRKEIFEQALHLAGNPEKCFMIGDNPKADVVGAARVHIPSILVHNELNSQADYNFKALSEIIGILE